LDFQPISAWKAGREVYMARKSHASATLSWYVRTLFEFSLESGSIEFISSSQVLVFQPLFIGFMWLLLCCSSQFALFISSLCHMHE
jgi:hypothetical protein